jgi:NADH:ubiquinone oxidoreductase subunit F (NADH-binding)
LHTEQVDKAEWRSPVEELLWRGGHIPAAAEHGARTYYADQSTLRGDRHVRVCTGTSCFVASRGRHVREVESVLGVRVGECAPDGSVSLQEAHCLGYCYAGPAALDGDVPHAGADLASQLGGKAPAQDPPIPAVATGRSILLHGSDRRSGTWRAWPNVVVAAEGATRVRSEVETAGLRGRGGAGFSTARKWSAVASSDGGPRFVVANGDEGDPGSFADRMLMESAPALVLEGLALAGLACGASQGYVYVRSEYPRAFRSMCDAVTSARAVGHLGVDVHGSGVDFDVEVVTGHGSYVAGEETSLLRSIVGLRGTVHPRPPYPAERGLLGRPTAVNNVETLAAVPAIMLGGGRAYAQLGDGTETGSLLISLNERFERPGVYEVEFGTSLRSIVNELGGGVTEGGTLRAIQVGGPLGGFLAPSSLHLPLLESAMGSVGLSLGHGGMVAIDDGVPYKALLAHLWGFGASESCGACTPCREGTRRGAADPERSSSDHALLAVMERASMCAFGRRLPAAVRSLAALRWE